jgi:ribonucleoside-diphosphate reductase beta chain
VSSPISSERDPAGRVTEPDPPALHDPQALYELWERQQWSAHTIDLSGDRRDWQGMPGALRERLLWHIGAFFVGEERVALELSPLVRAHESSAEAAFLATQQVDEVRHSQHFQRFYADVLGVGGDAEARLAAAREHVGRPLRRLLDAELADASDRLWHDPADAAAKVDFVVLYHMIIEGTLALTGQRVLLDFLERRALLPAWRAGLRMIARDEHRHVAYGAWLLREKCREPSLRRRVARRVSELLPLADLVLVPEGARPAWFRPLGPSGQELQAQARSELSRRLGLIGIPLG